MSLRFRPWWLACAPLALACATAPPAPVETGQLFLWRVERSDGSGGVAHLLGSVHMSEEVLRFDPAVERALAEAETLVLELDPEELAPAAMARLAVEKGHFGGGRTLDQVLSPDTWRTLEAYLAEQELPVAMFRPMEPWYALLTLQLLALQGEGFDSAQGVDMMLARSAEERAKPIVGLETAESQLDALDRLPLEFQERQLREFLALDGAGGDDVSLLIDAWRKGDAARFEAEVFGALGIDPTLAPYYELFYFERNRNMARGIAELVDDGGRWFVAVGAAHLVGAQGVPSLLAERGYTVRRVPKTP